MPCAIDCWICCSDGTAAFAAADRRISDNPTAARSFFMIGSGARPVSLRMFAARRRARRMRAPPPPPPRSAGWRSRRYCAGVFSCFFSASRRSSTDGPLFSAASLSSSARPLFVSAEFRRASERAFDSATLSSSFWKSSDRFLPPIPPSAVAATSFACAISCFACRMFERAFRSLRRARMSAIWPLSLSTDGSSVSSSRASASRSASAFACAASASRASASSPDCSARFAPSSYFFTRSSAVSRLLRCVATCASISISEFSARPILSSSSRTICRASRDGSCTESAASFSRPLIVREIESKSDMDSSVNDERCAHRAPRAMPRRGARRLASADITPPVRLNTA
ncbi:hypothetical protein Y027_5682 [Burkholderia pseudomallei TSV5]|nr:hypothetical protein Y027_5682 [Burkholderia pseudomallei TSV5]